MKTNEVLGCVGVATVLVLSSAYIPFLGSVFSLLTPLPVLYGATRHGLDQGVKIVVITIALTGIIAALTRDIHFLFLSIEFTMLGLIVSELFRRRMSIGYTVFLGTGLMLLLGFVILAVVGLSRNRTPMEMVLASLQSSLNDTVRIYKMMGVDGENPEQVKEFVQFLTNVLGKIYPALTIIGTGFTVWLNVVASKPLFRARKIAYPDFGPLDRWWAPDPMVWGLIAAGFSLFLPVPQIQLLAINAVIVLLTVYFFHGLSILLFFLNRYRVPLWVRLGVYALILFQQIFSALFAAAGLFDQWMDFRRIRHRKTE